MTNHYCPNVDAIDTRRSLTVIMLSPLRVIIDLNYVRPEGQPSAALGAEATGEFWQNDFLSTYGLSSFSRVPSLCRSSQGKLQSEAVLLLGSVPVYGICSTDLSRKPARYRSLFAFGRIEALSHGDSEPRFAEHFGQRESGARLAHLRRFRTSPDSHRARTLYQRELRDRTQGNCLCARCNDYRFVSVVVSLGHISQAQGCSETAYAFGSARQYSFDNRYYSRQSSRRKHPRSTSLRGRCHLRDGSWLSRFQTTIQDHVGVGLLRHTRQEQLCFQASLFIAGRQIHRRAQRSDHHSEQLLSQQRVSGQTASHSFPRCGQQQSACLLDQQLLSFVPGYRATLSQPMASRTLLQMDQTASANQGVLRYYRECFEDSNLDRDLNLRAGRDRQETSKSARQSLQNSTDSQRQRFRENAALTGAFRFRLQRSRTRLLQPTDSIRVTLGQ